MSLTRSTPDLARGDADPEPVHTDRLSTKRVIGAALRLVDDEGLDALTMRRLGKNLGCQAMSLYRYAGNRTALLNGVAELVLAELVIPASNSHNGWQGQLRHIAHSYRQVALNHPHAVPLLVTRPLSTPLGLRPFGTLRPLEQILQLLTDAGFPATVALHIYRIYFSYLQGHILTELQEAVTDVNQHDQLLRRLQLLPLKEFPMLGSLADDLSCYDGAAELDQALDIFFAGLVDSPAG